MPTFVYPPFELVADRNALAALTGGIAGYRLDPADGPALDLWLRDGNGRDWLVSAHSRALRFTFEVFALGILSIGQVHERWKSWTVPEIAADMPERLRSLLTTRPPEPVAPVEYEDWPLNVDRIEVLRRCEFLVTTDEIGPTLGSTPGFQSATPPDRVPMEATASCDVAVGLLFSSDGGARLLVAADWAPMKLIFTREADRIDAFLAACERIELGTYAETSNHD